MEGMGAFSFLRFSAPKQGLWSGTVLVAILPLIATSPTPLSRWPNLSVPASSPYCKRVVTASTSVLAWSGGCVTIYLQRLEECSARSKCCVSCSSRILRNCLPKRFFCACAQAAASLPPDPHLGHFTVGQARACS